MQGKRQWSDVDVFLRFNGLTRRYFAENEPIQIITD